MNELTLLSQALQQSRRSFLLRSASTLALPMSLVACGGGGGGSDDTGGGTGTDPGTGTGTGTPSLVAVTPGNARGSVVLPAGASVTVVRVDNAYGTSVPDSGGGFDFVSIAESEMFAVGLGPGGKMVLSGLLKAGTATQLSARSTAVCLAFTALAVGVYVPSTQALYLAAIQVAPSVAVLESAVAAAIVARGEGWLDLTDPPLKAALAAVQAALSPSALAAVPSMKTDATLERSSGSDGSVRLQGMVIDRTARTSGLQVTGDGVGTITITNYYRRRSYAYVDRVSYKETFAGPDLDSPAIVGLRPMKIDATKSITNTLVTLAQLYAGVNDFYDPVVVPDIPTPIAPASAALTTYRVTSVGLGVSAGDKALLTDEQRAGLRNVCAETVILDIFVPIVSGILIPLKAANIKLFIDTLGISLFKDTISALAAADDILLNKIVAADRPLGEVLWDTLLTVINSDSFKNGIILFFQEIIDNLGNNGFTRPFDSSVNVGAKAFLDAISAIDLTAQTMDLVVTGLSYAFSHLADRFEIDVTKSQVRLNPNNPQLDPASLAQTNFTASVIDADVAATDLSYHWTCSCTFGEIADGTNSSIVNGPSFDSNSANLAYTPRGQGRGGDQETITVVVYKGHGLAPGQANTRVPIGTATTTLTYSTSLVPASVQLLINTTQDFTAQMSASLLANGPALNYAWTVSGGGTVNGASSTTTTTPSVTYKAGPAATTDSLALVVTSLSGSVLTRASAAIGVLGSVSAGISPQNQQVPRSTVQNYVVTAASGSFPSGSTFKWVLTHTPDLFGRPQDIGASGGGTIGTSVTPLPSGVSPGASVTVTTTTPRIAFAANPFGPESFGTTFFWNPSLTLTVTVIGSGGNVLTTSSTTIYTQVPTSIILP